MKILIIGGAGFIGVNAAQRYLGKGHEVIVLDNLSRTGTDMNLAWLESQKKNLTFVKADIRDFNALNAAFKKFAPADVIFHFAAQVAVTTSVVNPMEDFQINAMGTVNVLEAMRLNTKDAILIFSSTNKVYGGMEDVKVVLKGKRYEYAKYPKGITEAFPLDFHSPYGCSKGCADQYVRDYSRIYDLRTVVFRQSCIYGIHQFGVEDQGWISHFTIRALFDKPITIYGDGKQVRDVLYVSDLIDGFDLAIKNIDKTKGRIYNIGGGKENKASLLEVIDFLQKKLNKKINYTFSDWRPGDQKIFVSDNTKLQKELGWKAKISIDAGIGLLAEWAKDNRDSFKGLL